MNTYLKRLMTRARLMKPTEEGESGTAAPTAVDRGDDFVPTAEDVEEAAKAGEITPEEAEAERIKLGLPKPKAAPAAKVDEEAEEEDEEEAAEGEPAKPAKKDSRMPLSRHEQILAKARARTAELEAQVAALSQGQLKAKTEVKVAELDAKVDELEQQLADAQAEGETGKATALMKEIRQIERQAIEQQAEARSQLAVAVAVEQVRFNTAVERLEAAYPQLVPENEDFDAELLQDVLDLQATYCARGMSATDGIQKAVKVLIKATTAKQEAATTVTPRADSAEVAAAAKKLERETAARKKNVDAANAQPASVKNVGADSDAAGGMLTAAKAIKMNWDDFTKLPEAELARMRGDSA